MFVKQSVFMNNYKNVLKEWTNNRLDYTNTINKLLHSICFSSSDDCFFRLEAVAEVQTFSSPGYPAGYPSKSRCQWQIRASEENAISVSFPVFDIEDDCSTVFVSIFDSLSPDMSQTITK